MEIINVILNTEEDILKGLNPEQKEVILTYGVPILTIAGAGAGKALCVSSDVHTPTGIVKMGDVYLGQDIVGSDGNTYQITGVYPQGKLQVVEVEFVDTEPIKCCVDHLWSLIVIDKQFKKDRKEIVVNTQYILDYQDRYLFYVKKPQSMWVEGQDNVKPLLRAVLTNEFTEMQCIEVNSPDHLYITNGNTLTHNTSTLTRKICHLVKVRKIPLDRLLAITFTNKASMEMSERVMEYLGLKKKPMWLSTFHSLAIKILRGNMKKIDFLEEFTIYSGSESKTVIKNVVEPYVNEHSLSPMVYEEGIVQSMISRIKLSVDFDEGLRKLKAQHKSMDAKNKEKYFEHIENMFNKYQETLKKNNALDFDDLLVNSVKILKMCDITRQEWQGKFDYVMADEYQDTNGIQYELMKLIIGDNKNNVMVVGDAFQAIYEWRGARAENILEFDKDFTNTKIIKLENNYRSTPEIIAFANKIVSKSTVTWKDKLVNLKSTMPSGQDVTINQYTSDESEAQTIVNQIQMLMRQGKYKYQDFTILLRMSFISRILEEYLIRYRVPYQILGGATFYERFEIKTLLSYLKFAVNCNDKISLDNIIGVPSRGIGIQAMESVRNHYTDNWLDAIDKNKTNFRGSASVNAQEFVSLFREITPYVNTEPHKALRHIINKIKFNDYLQQNKFRDSYEDRIGNINELLSLLRRVEEKGSTFLEFLTEFVTKNDQDEVTDQTNKVKLMTIHTSKGLEFPVVFIPAMEEGILPSARSTTNEQLEEERRLFYVSVTRAKKLCFISSARQRGFASGGQKQSKTISRFLRGM